MGINGTETLTWDVSQVAESLQLSRATVYSLVREGKLPAIRISPRRIVIPRASLSKFLETEVTKPITEITS